MKIAVVEDEQEEREYICSCIRGYLQEKDIQAELSAYGDGNEIVDDAKARFDVIFMDIDMDGLDGMSTARQIRAYDHQVMIVFITNMAGHAIEGYSVQALDLLVKPVSALRIEETLDKIRRIRKRRAPRKLIVKGNGKIHTLDVGSISYIEMYGRKIRIHCEQEVLELGGTLRSLEEQLADAPFFRCHQAFLVNLAHVSAIERCDVEVAGDRLPVSRQKRKGFVQAFARYLGGEL